MQTVLRQDYWEEIGRGLRDHGLRRVHVLLDADPAIITRRIEADEVESGARQWRLDHLTRYADARAWSAADADLVVDTSTLSPAEAAERISATLPPSR